MSEIEDESVALMITSPPYPMIEMWDGIILAGFIFLIPIFFAFFFGYDMWKRPELYER